MIPVQFQRTHGREPVKAWQPHIASPFVVFKDPASNSWTAGHILSGRVLTSVVPRSAMARKADVLDWLARMEAALPGEVLECWDESPSQSVLQTIRDWSVGDANQ